MQSLIMVSCLAENHRWVYERVASHLQSELGLKVHFETDVAWEERERMLYDGRAQFGFLCGLPYVRQADLPNPPLEALVAPVMRAPRYDGRPIYYSDVVVRADSPYQTFADLRGSRWCFNEPWSQSGHAVVLGKLARAGETSSYFAQAIASGSHFDSIRMVLEGEADCAALDTTCFEMEQRDEPWLAEKLRVVETIGPSPIQPFVASRSLPAELKGRIRQALLDMNTQGLPIARFVGMQDSDYDPIREMQALCS